MTDKLTDIYPIPVNFVPGQQPTAAFLNAWANQIDDAFDKLSVIIGDFTAESATMREAGGHKRRFGFSGTTNITRMLGDLAWLQTGLPSETVGNVIEIFHFAPGEFKSEFELTFPPSDEGDATGPPEVIVQTLIGANGQPEAERVVGPADKLDTFLATFNHDPNNPRANNPALTSAENLEVYWMQRGKIIRTKEHIGHPTKAGTIKVGYGISAGNQRENPSESSGVCMVPCLEQILADSTACSLSLVDPNIPTDAWISFPHIKYILKPGATGSDFGLSVLSLWPGHLEDVQWVDQNSVPKYRVPQWIHTLATEQVDNKIPAGLATVWEVYQVGVQSFLRRVSGINEGEASFIVDPADLHRIRVNLPNDIAFSEDSQYVVCFAGVSLAESVGHLKVRMKGHMHDGSDESNLISMESITDKFDSTIWARTTEGATGTFAWYDHYLPQYLHRGGWNEGDLLNKGNSMVGDLVLNWPLSPTTDTRDVWWNEVFSVARYWTHNSTSIVFGNDIAGYNPRIWFEPKGLYFDESSNNGNDRVGTLSIGTRQYNDPRENSGETVGWAKNGEIKTHPRTNIGNKPPPLKLYSGSLLLHAQDIFANAKTTGTVPNGESDAYWPVERMVEINATDNVSYQVDNTERLRPSRVKTRLEFTGLLRTSWDGSIQRRHDVTASFNCLTLGQAPADALNSESIPLPLTYQPGTALPFPPGLNTSFAADLSNNEDREEYQRGLQLIELVSSFKSVAVHGENKPNKFVSRLGTLSPGRQPNKSDVVMQQQAIVGTMGGPSLVFDNSSLLFNIPSLNQTLSYGSDSSGHSTALIARMVTEPSVLSGHASLFRATANWLTEGSVFRTRYDPTHFLGPDNTSGSPPRNGSNGYNIHPSRVGQAQIPEAYPNLPEDELRTAFYSLRRGHISRMTWGHWGLRLPSHKSFPTNATIDNSYLDSYERLDQNTNMHWLRLYSSLPFPADGENNNMKAEYEQVITHRNTGFDAAALRTTTLIVGSHDNITGHLDANRASDWDTYGNPQARKRDYYSTDPAVPGGKMLDNQGNAFFTPKNDPNWEDYGQVPIYDPGDPRDVNTPVAPGDGLIQQPLFVVGEIDVTRDKYGELYGNNSLSGDKAFDVFGKDSVRVGDHSALSDSVPAGDQAKYEDEPRGASRATVAALNVDISYNNASISIDSSARQAQGGLICLPCWVPKKTTGSPQTGYTISNIDPIADNVFYGNRFGMRLNPALMPSGITVVKSWTNLARFTYDTIRDNTYNDMPGGVMFPFIEFTSGRPRYILPDWMPPYLTDFKPELPQDNSDLDVNSIAELHAQNQLTRPVGWQQFINEHCGVRLPFTQQGQIFTHLGPPNSPVQNAFSSAQGGYRVLDHGGLLGADEQASFAMKGVDSLNIDALDGSLAQGFYRAPLGHSFSILMSPGRLQSHSGSDFFADSWWPQEQGVGPEDVVEPPGAYTSAKSPAHRLALRGWRDMGYPTDENQECAYGHANKIRYRNWRASACFLLGSNDSRHSNGGFGQNENTQSVSTASLDGGYVRSEISQEPQRSHVFSFSSFATDIQFRNIKGGWVGQNRAMGAWKMWPGCLYKFVKVDEDMHTDYWMVESSMWDAFIDPTGQGYATINGLM